MSGAVLIGGTGSDVGKSVIVAGLCRWLARQGVRVAPFKAQNMSLNSAVSADGGEIGRAQAAQALAAGIAPERVMNPILIKPTADTRAQVIVMGRVACDTDVAEYQELKPTLLPVVLDALADLRSRFDVVVCEGAGSIAEFNLRENDLVNLGLARAAGLPVLVVGDIDKGGVFASFFGSLGLLDDLDRSCVKGFIVNKFRGDLEILRPGLEMIRARTGVPVLGVLPWLRDIWIDAEDAIAVSHVHAARPGAPVGDVLDVAVIAYRRMSNFTDFDALALEPGVRVRFTTASADVLRADLCILPGSKHTVGDLEQLREYGLADALHQRARRNRPILGICAGYQMLGETIDDDVESARGSVAGLALLPVSTAFHPEKVLANRSGVAPEFGAALVSGYQIHNGRVANDHAAPLVKSSDGDDGAMVGNVAGTTWHGIFDSDGFRRDYLRAVAEANGLRWEPGACSFDDARDRGFDEMANAIESSLDVDALMELLR